MAAEQRLHQRAARRRQARRDARASARGWSQLAGRDARPRARTGPRSRPSCAPRAATGAVILKPQTRYFTDPPTETNEAAIETFWNGQLYTVLGKPDATGGWQLRLWWKPFVTLIWLGGALIALGGVLALLGRLSAPAAARARLAQERYA